MLKKISPQHALKSKVFACFLSSLATFLICSAVFFCKYHDKFKKLHNNEHLMIDLLFKALMPIDIKQCPGAEWTNMALRARCECTDGNGRINTNATAKHFEPTAEFTPSDLNSLPNVIIRWSSEDVSLKRPKLSQIKGRRILINYAEGCCYFSRGLNCETGLVTGGFDVCISFSESSLDAGFKQHNPFLFNRPMMPHRYWVWKPYIILKTLLTMTEHDVLFYADAGSHFVDNLEIGPIALMAERGSDIALFTYEGLERQYTKADTFFFMNCLNESVCMNSTQVSASFSLFRKSFRSIRFVSEWLTYAQDFRLLGDDPSIHKQNVPDFIGHRNDQSILSLLAKRWQLELWPDLSQWGENDFGKKLRSLPQFSQYLNQTFINHTRHKY